MTRLCGWRLDAAVVLALFVASFATGFLAMKAFRSDGYQPFFYQDNFEPAVMMACGRGFVSATPQTVPPELGDFLLRRRNDFDCALLSPKLPKTPVTWNATWYYLYGTTAAVWRVAGISWTSLDGLVAFFVGVTTVALYGLFRLVAVWWVAAGVAALLTVSPANLSQILSLRDYSKSPFVLLAILILATLVTRPMQRWQTLAVAAIYGALVGFGYGFRGDLAVMAPFGIFVVLFLLPGPLRHNVARNVLAAVLLIASFVVTASPALRGLSKGGCQFHYALLGLTTRLTNELGVVPAQYRFGDHFLDTFVDLKVADYADRVLNMSVPVLCSAEYDTASGQIYMWMAKTFPADLVVHAYGSVLMVLRAGLYVPAMIQPAAPFPSMAVPALLYPMLERMTQPLVQVGPLLTFVAIGLAWATSVHLGIAATVFILFLTGYPAIEFDQRHWFHLRFIPWWAGLMVCGELLRRGRRGWTRVELGRAAIGTVGLLIALGAALTAFRFVQTRTASALATQYLATQTDTVVIERAGTAVRVDWRPRDYAPQPAHRGSDLLVVTLDSRECGGSGPLSLGVTYVADVPSHDVSSEIAVPRPAVAAPTRVFVPVFWQGLEDQTELRFTGFEVRGATAACVGQVARVTDRSRLPLWIEMQLPPDWADRRLYQGLRSPRSIGWLLSKPVL